MKRLALVLAAGALLATGAAACEPPGPPPAFTVVTTAAGADATPGDGICATAQGACSLQAAVEEANALDRKTVITVPQGIVPDVSLTVTGSVELLGTTDSHLFNVDFAVAQGAWLAITDVDLSHVVVEGTFLARRVALGISALDGVDHVLDVRTGGSALITSSRVDAQRAPVSNTGRLVLHGVTLERATAPGPAAITTQSGGRTSFAATAVLAGRDAQDVRVATCAGEAATSYGYNRVPDATCGLAVEGDRQDFAGSDSYPDDDRVDAIPVGTLHCGEGWDDDIHGVGVRPADGDDDGTAACDIGAWERDIPV